MFWINNKHIVIKSLAKLVASSKNKNIINDVSYLLFDQARIVEGENPLDIKKFTERMSLILTKSLEINK